MAGRITLWGAGELLNTFFGRGSEPPTSYYLALIGVTPPTAYVSGAELDEPEASTGYARMEIPNSLTYWATDGQLHVTTMIEEIVFATATEDWGRIKYWALCNAPSEGFVYFTGNLEEELVVVDGDVVQIPADDLTVVLGPLFTEEG